MLQVSVRGRRALVREMHERCTSVNESLREKMTTVYFYEFSHKYVRFVRSNACFWGVLGGSRLFVHVVHGFGQGHGAAQFLPLEGRQVSRGGNLLGLSGAIDSGCKKDYGRLIRDRTVI